MTTSRSGRCPGAPGRATGRPPRRPSPRRRSRPRAAPRARAPALAAQSRGGSHLGGDLVLHVLRAAPPDLAVDDVAGPRVEAPLATARPEPCRRGPAGTGSARRSPPQPRDQVRPSASAARNSHSNPASVRSRPAAPGPGCSLPGRVDGVDPEQPLQQVDGLGALGGRDCALSSTSAGYSRCRPGAGETVGRRVILDSWSGFSTPVRRPRRRTSVPPGEAPLRCARGRGRSTSSWARSTCSPRARRCGSRSRPASPLGDLLRAAGVRQDDAGADHRRCRAGGVRGGVGGQRRPGRGPGGDRARGGAPPGAPDQPTIFFLDEIHRFNKAQQDALLPAVEEGLLTLIGATTENPYFEVNSALLSRAQIYELRPLDPAQIDGAPRSRAHRPRARHRRPAARSTDDALELLAGRSDGDARIALVGARAGGRDCPRRRPPVDLDAAEDALQRKALTYDREGDRHYDYISAWIKATRGSDPDASLYYLAVMLEGGEDPRFIARRMVILASEDVGNADPQALVVATAAAAAVDRVGLPECRLNLAQAAVYLALAPKSNASYRGHPAARSPTSASTAPSRRPQYLHDAHYPGREELGRGVGYVYPHDEPGRCRRPAGDPGGPGGRALLPADGPRLRGGARAAWRSSARRLGRASNPSRDRVWTRPPDVVNPSPVRIRE